MRPATCAGTTAISAATTSTAKPTRPSTSDRHRGHRRDALPVDEPLPHEPTDQHAHGQADHQRDRAERQGLHGDGAGEVATQEPERLEDREVASSAPDGGEQRVDEHGARHDAEDRGHRDGKSVDPPEAGQVAGSAADVTGIGAMARVSDATPAARSAVGANFTSTTLCGAGPPMPSTASKVR